MKNIVQMKEYRFNEKMLKAKDLKKIFPSVSQSTLATWAAQGLLNRYKICGGVFYKLSEIVELIENSKEIV